MANVCLTFPSLKNPIALTPILRSVSQKRNGDNNNPPSEADALLLEGGDFLLLEAGDKLLLES